MDLPLVVGVAILYCLGLAVTVRELRRAPEGFEDERGFQVGRKEGPLGGVKAHLGFYRTAARR